MSFSDYSLKKWIYDIGPNTPLHMPATLDGNTADPYFIIYRCFFKTDCLKKILNKHWWASKVGIKVFGKMVGFCVGRIRYIFEFLKIRCFKYGKNRLNECTLKNNVEILDLCIVFVVVFIFFLGKIIRVDVCNNLTLRSYLFVHKHYSTNDNNRHPPCKKVGE